METAAKYQQQLLEQSQKAFPRTPISQATAKAFLATPRHQFVKRYRRWGVKEWQDVTPENLPQHLGMLYANTTLVLSGDDDENVLSTISQPAFVLLMLDLLQLQPGHRVFELGAGSGWNAALIGHLVGPEGAVYSSEIIPELGAAAADVIDSLGILNVHIVTADGGDGHAPGAPYDRAIFTAGSYDLPNAFYEQLKEGALLLMVIKKEGGGDNLFLLRKTGDHFESLKSMDCAFVQLRGKYEVRSLELKTVESLPQWEKLQHQEINRQRFWWGGKGAEDFMWRTLAFRTFLSIVEPSFRAFKRPDATTAHDEYFGLWQPESGSLVLAKDDWLIAYGNPAAQKSLQDAINRWVALGMPSAASFALQVFPIGVAVAPRDHQWIVKRAASQFVWTLPRE